MKKWHMECIISTGRTGHKLQVPHPGQRTLWTAAQEIQPKAEFFLVKMMRAFRERVQRQC